MQPDSVRWDELPAPEWTPEAVAAAGGMAPISISERVHYSAFPGYYKLAGDSPDPLHKDVARVLEVAKRRVPTDTACCVLLPGLVIQINTPADRWYVCYGQPDAAHSEHWFKEVSGGQGEYFGPDDLDAFLARLDIPARSMRMEIRRGFRVIVFEEPGIGI